MDTYLYWIKTIGDLFKLCLLQNSDIRVFHKLDEYANIGIRDFSVWKQNKICWQTDTPSRERTQASHNLWFQVQHYPFWTTLTFVRKTETLLILEKSSKSKKSSDRWAEI